MNILTDLNKAGTTILIVTHSPTYAEYGNRIIHLFDGNVVTENIKRILCLRKIGVIKLNGIEKYYTNIFIKTIILHQINLEIEEGEFITVMGPSGAGKSTLLYILGMLDSPSDGEYYFYDEPVHKMSNKKQTELHKSHIGFVFQQYHLIDELTVYENIETSLLYQKIKSSEQKGIVADMLDRFNIVAKTNLFPNQMSGEQQQLVAVARALIINPKLILADEPTGNLNSEQGFEIMELLKSLNKEGRTIVQVTHDEKKAEYGNRIIHLMDGGLKKINEE